jgi:EAL domain-containing protein (putative c-di-GMP-specific phosphodiesterase class I)
VGGEYQGDRQGGGFRLPFSMAFQPIVELASGEAVAHEALVRGPQGQSSGSVLAQVDAGARYDFDQQCRVKAIELAAGLGLAKGDALLSINFMPDAVDDPRTCIRSTVAAAAAAGLPLERIIFEFTEDERHDVPHVLDILRTYRSMGFKTALDDFGAGHAGLSLLAQHQPDIVKLDMALIRHIDHNRAKRAIVAHLLRLLDELGVKAVCEGVETVDELIVLQDLGAPLAQGYVFGRPAFEALVQPASAQSERLRRAG